MGPLTLLLCIIAAALTGFIGWKIWLKCESWLEVSCVENQWIIHDALELKEVLIRAANMLEAKINENPHPAVQRQLRKELGAIYDVLKRGDHRE
jgi:hypothetical protein